MRKYHFLIIFALLVLLNSCKKEDGFTSPSLNDYYPLQIGKYITYDLDSTVFVNFGQTENIVSYQVQDRVDSMLTDNSGRPAYRIFRYIRKDASQEWSPNNTFMVVPTDNTIEYVENNLRFQKLKLPIQQGFSWKGNSYIDTYSINSDLTYLDDWDYTYDSVNVPLTFGSLTIDSTLKVAQDDEFSFLGNDGQIPGTQYAERNYGVEKYGKGIGLIYKEFLHFEYQGEEPGVSAYFVGYGVKLTIIDHN